MYLSLVWTAAVVLVLCLTACGHFGIQLNRRTFCYVLSSISPYGGISSINCIIIYVQHSCSVPSYLHCRLSICTRVRSQDTGHVVPRHGTRVTVQHKHCRLIAHIWPGILRFLDNL